MALDSKFTKPLRSNRLPKTLSHQSLAIPPTRLSHSASAPSIPRLRSLQSPNTQNPLSFTASNRPFIHPKRHSEPDNHHSKGQFQQPLTVNQQSHHKRRQHHRPLHDAPFTFPNGEVYIPRSKQRGSSVDIRASATSLQNLNPVSVPSNDRKFQHKPIHNDPSQPMANSLSQQVIPQYLTVPATNRHVQQNHQYTGSTTSDSTSPSPSRNSRSDSLNESTPSSSIDDLSIKANLMKDSGNATRDESTVLNNNTSNNIATISPTNTIPIVPSLDKIEEITPIEPAAMIADTGKASAKDEVLIREINSSKNNDVPERSSRRPLSSTKELPPTVKKPSKRKSVQQSPVPTVTNPVLLVADKKQVKSKPSILKRVFSSIFGRSKKKQNIPKSTERTSKSASQVPPTPVTKNNQDESEPLRNVVPSIKEMVKPEPVNDQSSDQFSFFDEEEQLNVEKTQNDFNSNDVLNSMFAGFSVNSSDTQNGSETDKVISPEAEHTEATVKIDHTDAEGSYDEDEVMSFDDIEMIQKIIQYGETSFPDLASPDLGEAQRKRIRSKSIERKKSIRSISSSRSKVSNGSNVNTAPENISDDDLTSRSDRVLEIGTSEMKEPCSSDSTPASSILRKSSSELISNKKVEFTKKIFINQTYSPVAYDRHSQPLTNLKMNPQSIHQIRYEVNEFKKSMEVHQDSQGNTHFFPS